MPRCEPVNPMRTSQLLSTASLRLHVWGPLGTAAVCLASALPILGCASTQQPIKLATVAQTPSQAMPSSGQVVPVAATATAIVPVMPTVRQVAHEERFSDQPAPTAAAQAENPQAAPELQVAARPAGGQRFAAAQGISGAPGYCPSPACSPNGVDTGYCEPQAGYQAMPGFIPNPHSIDANEFLCNGGDAPPTARARVGDQIIGVGTEDVVARYTTVRGEVHVTPSNRVCVYAPRFGSVRRVTGADIGEMAVGPRGVLHRDSPVGVDVEQPGLAVTGRDLPIRNELIRGPDAMRARDRGVRVENVLQPEMAEDVLALLAGLSIIQRGVLIKDDLPIILIGAEAATIWSVDQEVVVVVAGETAASVTRDQTARELVVYELPNGRMRVCKVADRGDALPGEIVTFLLRVDNIGDSPLQEIVVTDSLSGRLQYVPDSETNSADAEFSMTENDDHSLRLTWKFPGELAVGQGATIEFKCKVR